MDKGKSNVPEDLITDILSRLPVKSLLWFKCVDKFWYDRVENPTFISKHFKNHDDTFRLFYYNDFLGYQEPRVGLFLDDKLKDLSIENLDPLIPRKIDDQTSLCIGPLDGLFFLYGLTDVHMVLWNPATRKFGFLPKLDNFLPSNTSIHRLALGFERDPSNNDYKIVVVCTLRDDYYDDDGAHNDYVFSHVFIHTSGTNYWRDLKFDGLEKYEAFQWTGEHTYLNGVCYWLTYNTGMIASFHMKQEVFQEINTPIVTMIDKSLLQVTNNTLSLVILDIDESLVQIWDIKEGSWTKQSVVGPFPGIRRPLLLCQSNSFFLASNNHTVLLYDLVTQERKDLGVDGIMICTFNYKESLLPIKMDDT